MDTVHKDAPIRSFLVPSAALQPQEVSYLKTFAKFCTLQAKKKKRMQEKNPRKCRERVFGFCVRGEWVDAVSFEDDRF